MKKLLVLSGLLFFSLLLTAQDFVGTYRFQHAPFEKIVISSEDGVFKAEAEGLGKGEITATKEQDVFSEPNFQALLKFKRNESGKVSRLVLEVNGESYEGLKEMRTLDEYVGKYSLEGSAEVNEVSVRVQGESLFVEAAIGGSALIATDVKDAFQLSETVGEIVFTRDSNGKVVGIKVDLSGTSYKGTRK